MIATPAAIIFILGCALIYFALRGWDGKYGVFSRSLQG